jgi:hypothetical protein
MIRKCLKSSKAVKFRQLGSKNVPAVQYFLLAWFFGVVCGIFTVVLMSLAAKL